MTQSQKYKTQTAQCRYRQSDKGKATRKRYQQSKQGKIVLKRSSRKCALKRRYGLTLEEYDRILIEQNSCCAICGKHQSEFDRFLAVDHNHETGEIRGLLCFNCNVGLGGQECEQFIKKAALYLTK